MRAYIDVTGKTEEEAIRKALEQLGLDRDEVSVEVLERAKSGFLGFGRADAKVRIRYGQEIPDPVPETIPEPDPVSEADTAPEQEKIPAKNTAASVPVENTAPTDTPPQKISSRRQAESGQNMSVPDGEKRRGQKTRTKDTDGGKAGQAGKSERGSKNKRSEQTAKHKDSAETPEKSQENDTSRQKETLPAEEIHDEKSEAVRKFLSGLLEHMELSADIRVYLADGGRYKVILEGQGMGALIGRRGETLDAIQQLTNYAVNRNGNRVRIQLDAEGYREKREQSLKNLARKEAAKVVKYRRSRTLEPMNAYERHVIHTALQDFRGVNTYSTGVDPNRRVIIAYDREKL